MEQIFIHTFELFQFALPGIVLMIMVLAVVVLLLIPCFTLVNSTIHMDLDVFVPKTGFFFVCLDDLCHLLYQLIIILVL